MTTTTKKVVEMIRCMNVGEMTTSLIIANLVSRDVSAVSAALHYFDKKFRGKFVRAIGRLHRQGSAGSYIVVYEIIDPDYSVRLKNQTKPRIIPNRSYLARDPCTLPYLEGLAR